MSHQKYFASKNNCIQDLTVARDAFGNKNTTRKQYAGMLKGLGLMLMYCPEDIQSLVESTINEAIVRQIQYELHIWNDE